jgi:hypothetical protein
MKKLAFIVGLAAVLGFGFSFADMLSSLTAKPKGDGVTVEWRSEIEKGIMSYSVERSDVRNENDYQTAGTVSPKGDYQNYSFDDMHPNAIQAAGGATMKPQAEAFKYRIRVNLAGGEVSYSGTVTVTKPSSGVRRTWGMIKEMFH